MSRVPGPAWHKFFKTAIEFRKTPLDFIKNLKVKYGDFIRFQLGPYPAYLITNPDHIATILAKTDVFYKDILTKTVIGPLFGNGLALVDGDIHKKNRKLLAPAFYHSRIKLYAQSMADHTQKMMNSWYDGQEILLDNTMIELTLHIIAKTMFNTEVETTPELLEALGAMLLAMGDKLREPIPLPLSIPTKYNRQIKESVGLLDKMIFKIIRDHQQSGEDQRTLLSMLLSVTDENGEHFSDQQIRDEAMLMFVGGHETTARVLTWAFYSLAKHPKVRSQLEEELDHTLGDRMPTIDDLPNLPYTAMVIKETLRMYPPVWMTGRQATVDSMVGGHKIKKGSLVFVSPYLHHRDPNNFDSPELFMPERFKGGAEKKWGVCRYLPFGNGSRVCIGQEFASSEAILILASISNKFRLELVDDKPVGEFIATTLVPDRPIPLRIHVRDKNYASKYAESYQENSIELACPVKY